MMTKVIRNPDNKLRLLMEFLGQQGVKFVDADTREDIVLEEQNGKG